MQRVVCGAGLGLAAFLVVGCGGGSTPTDQPSSAPPSPADTEVTVQLSPSSGPKGTKITVTVPECEPGLKAGLAPVSRILIAPEDPTVGGLGGLNLTGSLASGSFSSDGTGTVAVPATTAPGTYYVGVQCPINLGNSTTGGFSLPDGTTADQGFGSATFAVT